MSCCFGSGKKLGEKPLFFVLFLITEARDQNLGKIGIGGHQDLDNALKMPVVSLQFYSRECVLLPFEFFSSQIFVSFFL